MISFHYALLGRVCTISLAISVSHRGISCRLSGRPLCAYIVFGLLLLTSKIAKKWSNRRLPVLSMYNWVNELFFPPGL